MPGSVPQVLPDPDFTWDPVARPPIAGLRPYRIGTFRLEPESVGGRFVVHNYGHGGAGITLSWGCAHEVVDILTAHGLPADKRVAVLGCGVMGLTAATLIAALGLKVAVYARDFPPHTTSNVAGGQWAPSLVNHTDQTRFDRILRRAYATHKSKGAAFGVSDRQNYTLTHAGNFDSCPRDVIPAPRNFAHLPFAHLTSAGYAYSTQLVEPPIFLAKMQADLAAAGVPMVQRTFASLGEVSSLAETVVVNCTGLGAKQICGDGLMHAVKGQLVLLPPQPALHYLFAGHHGYLFPRQDCVVVGGSEEMDATDATPNLSICKAILANMKAVFAGQALMGLAAEPVPDWAIKSKE